jgi:hypothetical protein
VLEREKNSELYFTFIRPSLISLYVMIQDVCILKYFDYTESQLLDDFLHHKENT